MTTSNKKTAPAQTPKILYNKYDQYEVQHLFNEATEDYLSAKFKKINKTFIIKCIVGLLLTINVYVSHWYPLPWPRNYYLLIFCVLFYYAASHYFESLDIVHKGEGGYVGEFQVTPNRSAKYAITFTLYSNVYAICEFESKGKTLKRKQEFEYNKYIDENGVFLKDKFEGLLADFLGSSVKSA